VLKQMRLIHNKGYTPDEIEDFRKIAFENIVGGMSSIIDIMDELSIAVSPPNRRYIQLVDNRPSLSTGEPFPIKYLEPLKSLWADPGVQSTYAKGYEYAAPENMLYFYSDLERMFAPDYKPNDQDTLRLRAKTTGITETRFNINDLLFRIFDLGGQRSERRKWASCFENVTSILFLVSLADYNACIIEDRDSNGMVEALVLWESVANSVWFTKSSLILFLNKSDLFAQKIQDPQQQISATFPDFHGKPGSYNDGVAYFKQRFVSLSKGNKEIYTHVTTAIDTENLKVVMAACVDTITRNQLRDMAII